jgi:phosphatidylglycerophosphate synthase
MRFFPKGKPLDRDLKREAFIEAGAGLGATVLLGWLAREALGFPSAGIAIAAAIFVLFMGFISFWLPEHSPHKKFGIANRITIYRAALVANLAAVSLYPSAIAEHGVIITVAMAATFALDGVDGWIARRLKQSSNFGARLDQELDALFTLVLSFALFRMEVAGAWILIAGAWHYFYQILRASFPVFRIALPFSQRRRVICGVVVASLIIASSPFLSAQFAEILALAAVMLLSASFLIDIVRQLRLKSPAKR